MSKRSLSSAGSLQGAAINVRGRIWIDVGNAAALTDAGADLLEQIEICQSLSEAARRLRFSYRRAWLLVNNMNRRWPVPLVVTATGGHHGGGTRLTEAGAAVLRAYRNVQLQVEHLLSQQTGEVTLSLRSVME